MTGHDRQAEVDAALLAPAVDLDAKTAVLRAPPLGDIELAENLEPRDHLSRAAIAGVGQLAGLEELEHAVDTQSNLEPVGQHFKMDVARPPADGGGHQLPHEHVNLGELRLNRVFALRPRILFLRQDLERLPRAPFDTFVVEANQGAGNRLMRS